MSAKVVQMKPEAGCEPDEIMTPEDFKSYNDLARIWNKGLLDDGDRLDELEASGKPDLCELVEIHDRALATLRFWAVHCPGQGFDEALRQAEAMGEKLKDRTVAYFEKFGWPIEEEKRK